VASFGVAIDRHWDARGKTRVSLTLKKKMGTDCLWTLLAEGRKRARQSFLTLVDRAKKEIYNNTRRGRKGGERGWRKTYS